MRPPQLSRSLPTVSALVALLLSATSWNAGAAPKYKNLRYEEDPESYQNPEVEDFYTPIKYIQLSDDLDINLSLGGQVRARWEFWENFGFGERNDADFGLFRFRLHGDVQVGNWFRVFVEGKSAQATSRDLPGGKRTLDVDSIDLQNAFFDVSVALGPEGRLTLRPGRQELQFGKQRLVSPLDWANTRRTFDGVRGIYEWKSLRVDAFYTRVVDVEKYEFNDGDSEKDLYGVYATGTCPLTGFATDLYYLGLDREMATFGGVAGDEERHTIGMRYGGKCGESGIDADVEGGYQFGDHADRDIDAWFIASQLGYQATCSTKPRVYVGYDYASGDDDPADGEVGTFNQLYPLAHAYNGYIDIVGRQNIMDFSQGLAFWPVNGKVLTKVEHHFLWRAEEDDALYNAGGGIARPGEVSDSKEVGSELDITVKVVLCPHSALVLGYSHFFAGDFIDQAEKDEETTFGNDDIDFAYTTLQYTF